MERASGAESTKLQLSNIDADAADMEFPATVALQSARMSVRVSNVTHVISGGGGLWLCARARASLSAKLKLTSAIERLAQT